MNLLATPSLIKWIRSYFRGPSPHFVKMNFLNLARDVDVWIETGTYLGQTTRKLSAMASTVISIEPSTELATSAANRLSFLPNIQIINALSEDVLEETISSIEAQEAKRVAFWLDGHFSEGNTFLGPLETPIEAELNIISSHIQNFEFIWVFIDDFRCFVQENKDYPAPSTLVDWAIRSRLNWTVENDIFLATNSAI